jgi:hypothetical protein
VARQALITAALAWAELPLNSSLLFIVPRVMQRDFGRVNCHIQYIGQFPQGTAIPYSPLSCPFVIVLPTFSQAESPHQTLLPVGLAFPPPLHTSLGCLAGCLHAWAVVAPEATIPAGHAACSLRLALSLRGCSTLHVTFHITRIVLALGARSAPATEI